MCETSGKVFISVDDVNREVGERMAAENNLFDFINGLTSYDEVFNRLLRGFISGTFAGRVPVYG